MLASLCLFLANADNRVRKWPAFILPSYNICSTHKKFVSDHDWRSLSVGQRVVLDTVIHGMGELRPTAKSFYSSIL